MELKKVKGQGPERISVDMLDPLFAPGGAQRARAPITISPSGLPCHAELYLGPDEATKIVTSGLIAFTSTGARQDVLLPVTMPSPATGTTYHVYLDVYGDDFLLGSYIATEDVTIPSVTVGPITWD